jgi:hypothetical protein
MDIHRQADKKTISTMELYHDLNMHGTFLVASGLLSCQSEELELSGSDSCVPEVSAWCEEGALLTAEPEAMLFEPLT